MNYDDSYRAGRFASVIAMKYQKGMELRFIANYELFEANLYKDIYTIAGHFIHSMGRIML